MRTFLSIQQSGIDIGIGDKILALGEKLPEDIARKVFTKYGEIIDNVNKITEFARSNFKKEIETNPELIQKIEETLYTKGKQLLSRAYEDVNNKIEVNFEDIGRQLDRINADTITTFAIFKQAIKNGEKLPIESIEGSIFSKKEAGAISTDQKEEMFELYDRNYKDHPDREFITKVKDYFATAFVPEDNKKKNFFYTFEKDNKIRAFVRFEKQNDASFYASALNVDEASKNFGLGEAMMDEALSREAKENILHATCLINNQSNMRYFEKGFISRNFKKVNNTNQLDLIWDENKNKDILSKQKSTEELIGMYGNTNTEDIEIRKSKDLESLHSDIPAGKSLVRCFINNGEWYAVYETIKEDYGMNLGETK
jgi:ribosomal protein S18 acetylase RimI-like enzyme